MFITLQGQAGGMKHDVVGGGVNTLCLPNDPENGHAYSYPNDLLYGSEYEIASPSKTSGLSSSLFQKEVPCAVCRRRQASSVIMIPGISIHFLEGDIHLEILMSLFVILLILLLFKQKKF